MNIAKFIVFFLCIFGTVWFPSWIIAFIVYEACIRRGKDVMAIWITQRQRHDNWD